MKNAVFWGVTRYGSCKNRRFEGTHRLHQQVTTFDVLETTLAVTIKQNTLHFFAACSSYC
jgi:hypothetical protein